MATPPDFSSLSNAIRFLSMDAVESANSGHPGLPMGAATLATVLFMRCMRFDPKHPGWPDRDRFILSAGHGSMLLYSSLYLLGYDDITLDELRNFRQLGSKTAGHPEYGHAAGIETTTGPLGQGIANAVGMALSEARLREEFGEELVNHYTYCLVGDGCLMEGISQEAITLAGHLQLNKLIVLWDNNNISIDGPVSLSDSTDQITRFRSARWNVLEIDGNDPDAIESAIMQARDSDKPTMISARTEIGFGAPTKAGTASAHGAPLGEKEISGAREKLNWESPPFEIPADICDAWRIAGLRSVQSHKEWEGRLSSVDSKIRGEFERRQRGDLPTNFTSILSDYYSSLISDPPTMASRKSSESALEVINAILPETIGGSADLTGSNNTKTSDMAIMSPGNFAGRFIHYGIREHAMAAMMNGMALHGGLIPYSGGFLVFSDYCRPSIRLAALMGIRVIHVMTHDSIGLGEDGPTHQPIEHLASLRAIPNLLVFRPADTLETAECWECSLTTQTSPSILALSRQNLEPVRLSSSQENLCSRGAYELAPIDSGDTATVSIFASGSEVSLALQAKAILESDSIATRVVSVPCFELFAQQSDDYRQSILGDSPVNIGVEAAIRQGWDSLIGSSGIFIGMESFGASAPADSLFKHFGITPKAIVEAAKEALK